MSRHYIPALIPRYTAVVGWEPIKRTFFAQVMKLPDDPRKDTEVLFRIGDDGKCPGLLELVTALEPYAVIDAPMVRMLTRDKTADQTWAWHQVPRA